MSEKLLQHTGEEVMFQIGSLGFSVVLKYCEINRLHEFFISVGEENGYI